MDSYVTEIMDYIEAYRSLIKLNLYDDSKKQDIEEISSLLDELTNKYNSKKGLESFDFSLLRKRICYVFHPDVYKQSIPRELGIDSQELIAKFNGAIVSILKGKRNGEKFNYDYSLDNDYKDNGGYNDVHDDYGYESYRRQYARNYQNYDDQRWEERKRQFSQFAANAREKVKDVAQSAFTYSKERVGAWFFDIPANRNDYYNIKTGLRSCIENLQFRKNLAVTNARVTARDKATLINRMNAELSRNVLESKYDQEIINSYNRIMYLERELDNARRRLDARFGTHRREFDQIMKYWERTSGEIFADYMNTRVELKNKQDGYIYGGRTEKDIKKDIKKYERELDRYPKRKEAVTRAIEHVTKDDKVYKQLRKNYEDYRREYDEACRSHDYLITHKNEIMDSYVKETRKKYNSRILATDLKIKHFELRQKMLGRDLQLYKDKLSTFVQKYEHAFENTASEERGRSR